MAAATLVFEQPCPPASSLLHFPPLIDETSLYDLANVVRNRNYHAHRNDVTRAQLEQVILANGLIARLTNLLWYTRTLLVRHIIQTGLATDSSNNFSALNQASQDLQRSIIDQCNAPVGIGAQPTDAVYPLSGRRGEDSRSFLDELSPTASTTILKFLSTLRADPTFLASRLLQAKDQDFDTLISWNPHHYSLRLKSNVHPRLNASLPSIEHIASFSRHDPLYALTSVLFSPNPSPESSEFHFRIDTWSTAFAHLIDENRGGELVSTVMDVFSGSEWTVDSAIEVAILNFLQDAARLNKSVPDDDRDEDDIEADSELTDLCDETLADILSLISSEGGIPAAVVMLANATSAKCTNQDLAKTHIGTQWFQRHCLSKRIITPEYFGILNECFISRRQRNLLKLLYNRIEKYWVSMDTRQPSLETEHEAAIYQNLDTIMAKLIPDTPQQFPQMMESETMLQDTFTLCPSDIITLFYALYPRHRPKLPQASQTAMKHTRKRSDESTKSDITRLSTDFIRPILKRGQTSEINDGSSSSVSELEHTASEPESPATGEEEVDLYALSVKAAIDEMKRRLGHDACSGEKHPCEETWATLYISRDGTSLSRIPDFEVFEPSGHPKGPILSTDEDAIIESTLLKLAEDKPQKPIPSQVEISPTPYRFENKALQADLLLLTSSRPEDSYPPPPLDSPPEQPLLRELQIAASRCFVKGDYYQAQSFQNTHQLLKSISAPSLNQNNFSPIISTIARKIRIEGNHLLNLSRTRENWLCHLLEQRRHLDERLSRIILQRSQLRCKMWYQNHVRHSKAWQRAKDVCQALHKMKVSKTEIPHDTGGDLKRNNSALSLSQHQTITRHEGRRFIPYRQPFDGFGFSGRPASLYNVSMAQEDWFDILSASAEQGGPHKLSDYQVDVTNRWLEEHASENFCRGEEIIHRFIAEVDDVSRRMVPDTATEMSIVASTFWEGEEFVEEAREFGLLEIDAPREETYGRRSEELPRTMSGVDLFGLLSRSRRGAVAGEAGDSRSVRSMHSRTTSLSVNTRPLPDVFVRPSSSHSISLPPPPSPAPSLFGRQPHSLVPMVRSMSQIDEKAANKYLDDTRQRLLSLLLSDIGMDMWAGGSETDEWFSDGLANACFERGRNSGRKPSASGSSRKERKLPRISGSKRPTARRAFSLDIDETLPTPPLSRESSTSGPETSFVSITGGFDFKTAYKKLLLKFSVHPAPHEKLNALFELERLMTASFSMATDIQPATTSTSVSRFPPSPQTSPDPLRKASTSSAIGTDDLIDEIQKVLRDSELRPKTLFRDLSFISAFISPVTLAHHGEGKVFWDIGLAASAMKSDVVNTMVEWYEEIMRGNERVSARRQVRTTAIGNLHDAAKMLVIAACEGNAVAQRELALLHLSHPSLLPLTTLPLTRPSDTFQKVHLKGVDKEKYDPDRIALASHWFRIAARNGDKYAKNVEGNWFGSKA